MKKVNQLAWAILTQDERTALTLQFGMQKSTWQSGEVMEKSHYKYLEIKSRAEHFLRTFTEHAKLFDSIIPKDINCNPIVLEYLKATIERREKPMWALEKIKETHKRITKSLLNEKIIAQLEQWEFSSNAYDVTTYNLVMDFDRWNNFRILPKSIQEPSAFKRRIKNGYKRHIKIMLAIPSLSLDRLMQMYQTQKQGAWLPMLYNRRPMLVKVKINNQSWKIFRDAGLYVFNLKADAQEYIDALHEYATKNGRDCTDGLNFWPIYRESIKKAKNYQDIQKITPSRRFLSLAVSKLEYL